MGGWSIAAITCCEIGKTHHGGTEKIKIAGFSSSAYSFPPCFKGVFWDDSMVRFLDLLCVRRVLCGKSFECIW